LVDELLIDIIDVSLPSNSDVVSKCVNILKIMAEFINVEKKINEGILPEPLLAEELKEGDEVMAVMDQLMGEVLPVPVHQLNAHVVEDEDESEQSMDDPHPLGMDDDEDEEMDGDEDDDMEGDGIDDDEEDPDEEEH
jgi:hypothetical protein